MKTKHSALISRRSFINTLGLGAIAVGLDGFGTVGQPSSFRFVVINDLHHASVACDPFFARLVSQVRQTHELDFCLILGDLADNGRPESLRAVRDAFALLGVPVYTVPGNHDCDQEQNTRLYSEVFPGRLNYHFLHREWQFVGLDTTDGNQWTGSRIQSKTMLWLDEALPRLDPAKPTVVFTHFPLLPEVNPQFVPVNSGEVSSRFKGWNVRCLFSGHYHARTEYNYGTQRVHVTNCCCSRVQNNHDGTIPEGYLVCTALPNGTLHRDFVRFVPAERTMTSSNGQ